LRIQLMQINGSFSLKVKEPWNSDSLVRDLDLLPLIEAMGGGDDFVKEVSRKALLLGAQGLEDIRFRQEAMRDALRNPEVIRTGYRVLSETVNKARERWLFGLNSTPTGAVFESVELLKIYMEGIDRARESFASQKEKFESRAFRSLIAAFEQYFDEEYTATVREALEQLDFYKGMTIQVSLSGDAQLRNFKLVRVPRKSGLKRVFAAIGERRYSWNIPAQDEGGLQELENIRNLALERTAKKLSVASSHVLEFVNSLRTELGFYVGSLNLWDRLKQLGIPLSFPEPLPPESRALRFRDLVEASLALRMGGKPVSNSLDSGGRPIILISGPNKGGKTVFLRSIGQAQLMMMAGMFVAAEHFESSVSSGIFTHFKTEERANLSRGRLEEEVARMSEIAEHIRRGSLLLMNESFSSTNEREGSEIAREVIIALAERGIRIIFVTHFYELQRWLMESMKEDVLFLRAERKEDGTRTYRIIPGAPEKTSYADEVYSKIFGEELPKAEATE